VDHPDDRAARHCDKGATCRRRELLRLCVDVDGRPRREAPPSPARSRSTRPGYTRELEVLIGTALPPIETLELSPPAPLRSAS